MKRMNSLCRTLCLLLALFSPNLTAASGSHAHGNSIQTADYSDWQGQTVDIFGSRAIDLDGKVHRLGIAQAVQPVAMVFLDRDCPVSNRYASELNHFDGIARAAGVQFYGIISDSLMTTAEARTFVDEYGFDFPVLWDPSGDLAGRTQPVTTPEVYVIGGDDQVLYRGRIDNRFESVGVLRQQVTAHDLRDVLEAIGEGQPVSPYRTAAVGCFFEAWDNRVLPETVTYERDIHPLVMANCTECHRTGSVAPFPLETFEQVRRRARTISLVTSVGLMPPWPAAKGYGHFRDERHLSNRQVALLSKWAEQGTQRGDPEQALPATTWPSPDWLRGEPDLVIEMEEAFEIPAGGDDIYRYFTVPVEIPKGKQVIGIEFRPGDPKATHHTLVYVDYTGRARAKDQEEETYGFEFFGNGSVIDSSDPRKAIYIGGWAPGIDPLRLPAGFGLPLHGGKGHAVFEMHYRPTGKPTKDRSRIGLYFAKEPVSAEVASTVAGTVDVNIEPEDTDYWRQVYMDVPEDIRLVAVSPHMHYIGKEVKAVATLPDGSRKPLVHIPNWDFRWQNIYMFREPIPLPAGTRIEAWFKFDNSSKNPANPHVPAKPVSWGWSSDEEMCELWMRFVADDADSRMRVRRSGNRSWGRRADLTEEPPDW